MGRTSRLLALVGVVAVVATVVTSCGVGQTHPATFVSDVSAQLNGQVSNTAPGPTEYWFEYGPTTAYGSSTPPGWVTVGATDQRYQVSAGVRGLAEATTYHHRLCARGEDGKGICSADRTFVTTSGRDSVTGKGILVDAGYGAVRGATIDASSSADGSSPTGAVSSLPGSVYFKIPDEGVVLCLRVVGNRASVIYLVTPPDLGQPPPIVPFPLLVYVEDNGPTGDRLQLATPTPPARSCPEPTADVFTGWDAGGFHFPARISQGDYVVHDHLAAP